MNNRGWYQINPDGLIVNTSSVDLIPASIKPALFDLTDKIASEIGPETSVYLRGSAARGDFIQGSSDIDLIVIYQGEDGAVYKNRLIRRACKLIQASSLAKDIDFNMVSEKALKEDEDIIMLRFLVQISGVCLVGNKNFNLQPNPVLAKSHYQISALQKGSPLFDQYLAKSNDEATLYFCHWILKTIVWAGFELNMVKENKYTRNLDHCLESFTTYYPRHGAQMEEALGLARKPVSNSDDFKFLVSSLSLFILEKSKELIK